MCANRWSYLTTAKSSLPATRPRSSRIQRCRAPIWVRVRPPVGDQPLLEVRDVCASYEGVEALHRISFGVQRGTVTAILGANGAGKSTLLAVIAGILAPTEGEVRFDGELVTGGRAASFAREGLCLIPEGRGVFPNLTVRENLWVMTHSGG